MGCWFENKSISLVTDFSTGGLVLLSDWGYWGGVTRGCV